MGSAYQGSTHKKPDTSALVLRIATKARELHLQEDMAVRLENSGSKSVLDLRLTGRRKFQTSSLATFNKKMNDIKNGRAVDDDETDDLPRVDFNLSVDEDGDGEIDSGIFG